MSKDRRKFMTFLISNRNGSMRLQYPVKNWTDAHEAVAQKQGGELFDALIALEMRARSPREGEG